MNLGESTLGTYKLTDYKLIGISGRAGSGKNTVYDYLKEQYVDVYEEAFADPLKFAASEAFGIPLMDFYEPEKKEIPNPYWGVSPRKIAQFVGTEMFRNTVSGLIPGIESNFWIRRLESKLTGQSRSDKDGDYIPGDVVVITDVRFQNEYDWIIKNGGWMLFLERDSAAGEVGIAGHASESGIANIWAPERTQRIYNNHSLEVLYEYVDLFIEATGFQLCKTKFDVSEF